jgi:hypothetical protein
MDVEDKSWYGNERVRMRHIKSTVQETNRLDRFHAFACFHPGIGTNTEYTWREAFAALRRANVPILVTAYDMQDARKDERTLRSIGFIPSYEPNPFQSTEDIDRHPFNTVMNAFAASL